MFMPGARLKVYTSTFTGKRLGPRKNSVGYFIQGEGGDSVMQHKGHLFFLIPMHITFLRYGNEKKRRNETKKFLGLLPLSVNKSSKLRKDINNAIDYLSGPEFYSDEFLRSTNNQYKASAAGIILPSNKRSKMDFDDFKAWFFAILKNHRMISTIVKSRNFNKLLDLHPNYRSICDNLYSTLKDGSARKALLEYLEENNTYREDAISFLMLLNYTLKKRKIMSEERDWAITLKHHIASVNLTQILKWQNEFMFEDLAIFQKKYRLIKKFEAKLQSGIRRPIRNMAETRKALVTKYI